MFNEIMIPNGTVPNGTAIPNGTVPNGTVLSDESRCNYGWRYWEQVLAAQYSGVS